MPTKREDPPTPFSRATARAIKDRISGLGVANAAVARKTGLSPNYLNERLREEKSFTLSDIEKLTTYFGIDAATFMCSIEVEGEAGARITQLQPRSPRPTVSGYLDDSVTELDTAAGTDETQADDD